MKDFLSLASRRQSDRAFDPQRPVEKEKLQRILEAACIAPSACNSQPWHFIVVDDPELKNRVADATSNRVLGMNHFTKRPLTLCWLPKMKGWGVVLSAGLMKRKFVNYWISLPANVFCWTSLSAILPNRTDLRNAKI